MLKALSGKAHKVYTGITVLSRDKEITRSEVTEVFFRELDDREIKAYVKSGEPMDKAGAYGAQGLGSVFIERIEGDFYNVMGLPLCMLENMLREAGLDVFGLWRPESREPI